MYSGMLRADTCAILQAMEVPANLSKRDEIPEEVLFLVMCNFHMPYFLFKLLVAPLLMVS